MALSRLSRFGVVRSALTSRSGAVAIRPTLSAVRPSIAVAAPTVSVSARWMSTTAPVTAAMVKVLRDRTGAGLMECKHALAAAAADSTNEDDRMTRAAEILRKKGIAVAAKKSGRLAAQGLVGVLVQSQSGAAAMVEVNSETDFVARNAKFQRLVADITLSAIALPSNTAVDARTNTLDLSAVNAAPVWNNKSKTVADLVLEAVAAIKENLQIRRVARVSGVNGGAVFGYVHSPVDAPVAEPGVAPAPSECAAVQLGRIGSLIALSPTKPGAALEDLGNSLTMHIVASAPSHLRRSDVPVAAIEKEKELLRASASADHQKRNEEAVRAGKPTAPEPKPAQLEKMLDGKLKKWLTEQVLLDQTFVGPDSAGNATVEKVLVDANANADGFARFSVGEGLNPLGSAPAN